MKYVVTLEKGETREIFFCNKPVYRCREDRDGTDHYLTEEEIEARKDRIEWVDQSVQYNFHEHALGYCENEAAFFMAFKLLRNQIVRLELIHESLTINK